MCAVLSWQSRGSPSWRGSVFSRVGRHPGVFSWENKSVFPLFPCVELLKPANTAPSSRSLTWPADRNTTDKSPTDTSTTAERIMDLEVNKHHYSQSSKEVLISVWFLHTIERSASSSCLRGDWMRDRRAPTERQAHRGCLGDHFFVKSNTYTHSFAWKECMPQTPGLRIRELTWEQVLTQGCSRQRSDHSAVLDKRIRTTNLEADIHLY